MLHVQAKQAQKKPGKDRRASLIIANRSLLRPFLKLNYPRQIGMASSQSLKSSPKLDNYFKALALLPTRPFPHPHLGATPHCPL